jgi:hypothetical protein
LSGTTYTKCSKQFTMRPCLLAMGGVHHVEKCEDQHVEKCEDQHVEKCEEKVRITIGQLADWVCPGFKLGALYKVSQDFFVTKDTKLQLVEEARFQLVDPKTKKIHTGTIFAVVGGLPLPPEAMGGATQHFFVYDRWDKESDQACLKRRLQIAGPNRRRALREEAEKALAVAPEEDKERADKALAEAVAEEQKAGVMELTPIPEGERKTYELELVVYDAPAAK